MIGPTLARVPAIAAITAMGALLACASPRTPDAPQNADSLRITTTLLPAAPNGESYEPTLAIDPENRDHLIVAAMNGNPPVGKSTGAWMWRSTDGGKTWGVAEFPTPRPPGLSGAPIFGADVVAGFAADGMPIVASMSGIDTSMATYLSRVPAAGTPATSQLVFANFRDSLGRTVFYDKPWLMVDRVATSPQHGAIYLSSGALPMEKLPEKLGSPWGGRLVTRLELATSRDNGRTFSPSVTVSDSAFAGQLVVAPDGALEITYARVINMSGSADAIFDRRSTDGGHTFSAPTQVVRMTGDTLLDVPVLAGRPNGDLLACWSQGVRARERENAVRCSFKASGQPWSAPHAVDTQLAPNEVAAWPAIVGTASGWYLLQYVVHANRTDVVLYDSRDGVAFTKRSTLQTSEGLGPARFCVTTTTPCRRSRPDGFIIGDYVTLTASRGRLAAAYILPRHAGAKPDSASVYVTIADEPPER